LATDLTKIDVGLLIPPSMKNNFWLEFCDSLSDEMELFKTENILKFKDYYNVKYNEDIDNLLDIAQTMGSNPDRSLDSSIDFLQKWCQLIYYKVKYKSTYIGYDYIFNLINFTGDVYNLYWDDARFKRGVDEDKVLLKLKTTYSYIKFDTPVEITLLQPTGLLNDSTVYTLYIIKDDVITDISLVGSDIQTYGDLITEISALLVDVTLTANVGDFEFTFTSDDAGAVELFWCESREFGLITSLGATLNSELKGIDYSDPFIYFYPIFYYVFDYNFIDALDKGGTLDSGLKLDNQYFNSPTSHLAVSYSINRMVSDDYLITNDYLNFLLNGVNYNRQASEVGHVGFQLNLVNDLSGFYNNISGDRLYTIPDLKMKITTSRYSYMYETIDVSLDTLKDGSLTEYEMDLDVETPFKLDSGFYDLFDLVNYEDTFYKLKLGNGGVGTVSIDYSAINQEVVLYLPSDHIDSGNRLIDYSLNNRYGILYNSPELIDSKIDKGIYYDGVNQYCKTDDVLFDYDNKTFSFWFNKNKKFTEDEQSILSIFKTGSVLIADRFLDIYYSDGVNENLTCRLSLDGITNYDIVTNYVLEEEEYYLVSLVLDIDDTGFMYLYINGVLIDSVDISGIGDYSGNYDVYMASNNSIYDNWNGVVEELRIYGRGLSADEILFLYDSMLGNYYKRWNMLYETTDFDIRTIDSSNEWAIVSTIYHFDWLVDDLNELVQINECCIENKFGEIVLYASFPTCEFKKRYHIEVNWMVKLT